MAQAIAHHRGGRKSDGEGKAILDHPAWLTFSR
jgi:hypothetical protein